ncbi:MAG: dicarboxylate/amino acid:cation symporter [Candidatus Liberibacter ctenarytainae]|uniref:Dicarboxylate/amino acid:cation symporter n=1 Tax=Candidatus Liberibacter ctenarytainae TaxID=2020335 RepID=A0A937AKF2_9HYPH|nr:dicarboxylate/amino acid:cation symporter [Candidatus Liberibacter ctenarytainae]
MFLEKIVNLNTKKKMFLFYIASISIGIFSGITNFSFFNEMAEVIAAIFIRLFKFISLPLISLSLLTSLAKCTPETGMVRAWIKTVYYTIFTTMFAALVALIMYNIISPMNMVQHSDEVPIHIKETSYVQFISNFIPENFVAPFLESHVIGILLISGAVAIAIHFIDNARTKDIVITFFIGMHSVFFTITQWVMKIIPIAVGSFIAVTILNARNGANFTGLGEYLSVIALSNIVQGAIILPTFLLVNGLNPLRIFKGMSPALLVAFFSKSSAGTLPVTMRSAEQNLNISPQISRSILPFCTSVNMNGCAVFILITVVYVMQNNGIVMSLSSMFIWVIIASLSAIGNAGVPMGCFFLSASLLTNIGVPIHLMSVILPFYAMLDMLETGLNVWSDCCVTAIIDKRYAKTYNQNIGT